MQTDFHYCAILILARHAGFSPRDAQTIARVSQYADDAKEGDTMRLLDMDGKESLFDPLRTAWMGLESAGADVQRKVFMPFHFLPSRIPETCSPCLDYQVVRDGEMANVIVDKAIGDNSDIRLHRLGLALHSYADTWAHDSFSGRMGDENDIEGILIEDSDGCMKSIGWIGQLWRNIRPDLGHIEAGHIPDQSWVVWEYERSGKQVPTVSNPEKFYQAAKACFRKLVLAAGKHGLSPKPWEEIGDRVKRCLAKRPDCEDQDDNKSLTRNKCEHWESEFGDLFFDDGGEHLCYDRLAFRRTAFENSPDELDWDEWDRGWTLGRTFAVRREFFESDWVKFHRAALIQRALFEHLKMQNRS